MKLYRLFPLLLIVAAAQLAAAQRLVSPVIGGETIPDNVHLAIVKAEDARDAAPLEAHLKDKNAAVRYRAALAAGRIGDEQAVAAVAALLKDGSPEVAAMAAFALGEIESINAADYLVTAIKDPSVPDKVRARSVEAAGKIVAAGTVSLRSRALSAAVKDVLEKNSGDRETIILALTAATRAKPENAGVLVSKYLTSNDARVRADAAFAMARLRSTANTGEMRSMLRRDPDPDVRASAARTLGTLVDQEAAPLLIDAAVNGDNERVRVAAIRSLAAIKDPSSGAELLKRGEALLREMSSGGPAAKRLRNPSQKNELLEVATVVGRLYENSEYKPAIEFFEKLRKADGYASGETEIAFARAAPKAYMLSPVPVAVGYSSPWAATAYSQGLAQVAAAKNAEMTAQAGRTLTSFVAGMGTGVRRSDQARMLTAMPDVTRAMAALKPDNLNDILLGQLRNDDVFIRTAAAELLASQPKSDENINALKSAFTRAAVSDTRYNDAQLAILDALFKLDKRQAVGVLLMALNNSPDHLIRAKAAGMLRDKELMAEFPGIPGSLESADEGGKLRVLRYTPPTALRSGQILNTDADYRRALSRKNGSVKAVITTEKGTFTLDFRPEEAPLTVDNFVRLANARYFNGLTVHRVVPNFVMQDGDTRGDGNGGPGWTIRCEINMLEYDRGAVGMALSGKDTGGSQWFVTHSPQPFLDGGYTVFGHVNETDMKVVDSIARGDRIKTIRIIGR